MADKLNSTQDYGRRFIAGEPLTSIPDRLVSPPPGSDQPAVVMSSLQTRELPLRTAPADIVVGASASVALIAGAGGLPSSTRGFRFIKVTDNVTVSVNGGGPRTVLDRDFYDGFQVNSLQVITDGTGGCILQVWGE